MGNMKKGYIERNFEDYTGTAYTTFTQPKFISTLEANVEYKVKIVTKGYTYFSNDGSMYCFGVETANKIPFVYVEEKTYSVSSNGNIIGYVYKKEEIELCSFCHQPRGDKWTCQNPWCQAT